MHIEGTPMIAKPGRQLPSVPSGRQRRIISAALAVVLAAGLGSSAPAFAGDLEDQQAALKDEAARVQQPI